MPGRPTKYTPVIAAKITSALSAGNTRKAAYQYAGITDKTFASWLRRFSEFSEAVEKAEADAEVRHVANIAKAAGEGTWTASAWWLERRRNADWGRMDKVQVEHVVRQEAERIGAELGLPADQVLREAGVSLAN